MHAALMCVVAKEMEWGLTVRLEHIPTEDNTIAIHLSRGGRLDAACSLVAAQVGWVKVIQMDQGWVATIEKCLRGAAPLEFARRCCVLFSLVPDSRVGAFKVLA